ncbi:MAG: MFS transporter [Saprospirales bacterium]|nr:MAG: MFS transporter [Saprospirales bacterium]
MKAKKMVLYVLAGVNFTHIMFTMVLMPLGDELMREFNISAFQFSHLITAYALAAFFSGLAAVFFMDRFNRKTTLLFLFTAFWIAASGCSLVRSYEQLLLLRFMAGAFGGILGAVALAIVSDLYSFKERGTAIGLLMAGFSAAAALGVPVGLLIADWLSWRATFLFVGVMGIFFTILILIKFPPLEVKSDEYKLKKLFEPIKQITTSANQLKALVAAFTIILGHFLIIPFIAPFMIRNVGFSMTEISYLYFAGGFLTIFSTPIIGKLTDRIGSLRSGVIFMILSFLPVVLLTHMSKATFIYGLIVIGLFYVLGSGRMIGPQTIITAAAPPETRGAFMSLKSSVQQLAIAFAGFFSGLIVFTDGPDEIFVNYDNLGYLSILICLVALGLIKLVKIARGN